MNPRVALVDDHASIRAGYRMILESAGMEVVGEASSGLDAVELVQRTMPDVLFMDIQMPGMDGVEATRMITTTHPDTRVVVVTTFDRDDYLFAALDAGASGFFLKTAAPEDLISAARVVASGEALLAPEVTRRVIERGNAGSTVARADAIRSDLGLTNREREVLRLLAAARSNAEIADELYVGEATVKTHVSNILMKLGVRDRLGAVVFAHRNNLT